MASRAEIEKISESILKLFRMENSNPLKINEISVALGIETQSSKYDNFKLAFKGLKFQNDSVYLFYGREGGANSTRNPSVSKFVVDHWVSIMPIPEGIQRSSIVRLPDGRITAAGGATAASADVATTVYARTSGGALSQFPALDTLDSYRSISLIYKSTLAVDRVSQWHSQT